MRRRSKQTTTTKELGGGRGIYSRAKVLGALALLAFLLFMNFSIPLNPYAYHDNNLDLGKSIIKKKKGQHFWEHQYQFMYNQRRALINESSIIDMQFSGSYPSSDSELIDYVFGKDIQEVKSWKDILSLNETARNSYLEDFANDVGRDLVCGRLCDTIQLFRKTNGVRSMFSSVI